MAGTPEHGQFGVRDQRPHPAIGEMLGIRFWMFVMGMWSKGCNFEIIELWVKLSSLLPCMQTPERMN